jgi:hypothetical protein
MKEIAVEITGVTPLLINRFHEEAQAESTRGVHTRHETTPEYEDAAGRLYQLDGVPYFPAENLRQAIITAAARHKIGRRSAAGDMAAALYLTPEALTLAGDWTVDSRPVVIPATRGRVVRHRPRFAAWVVSGTLTYDERLVDARLVRDCVDDAGDYVGIGDFRPAKRGPYGRFRVTSWQER